ncbi:hypothetical protein FJTKL_01148 [Diaporthe vaccinii]|uniref:Alcohol dehydrogenase-like N-terminal domain-containing protein n=1 Tax=Diaporthe vaccinii TaxID=105482 RepID=A0ABR4F579_9PEZI
MRKWGQAWEKGPSLVSTDHCMNCWVRCLGNEIALLERLCRSSNIPSSGVNTLKMTSEIESLPKQQRAIVEDEAGQPVLTDDVALPALLPKTLLAKTTAVAINPFDYKMPKNFPSAGAIIGIDFIGRIVRIDAEAAALRPDLSVGDTVCGFIHGSNPAAPDSGAFAEKYGDRDDGPATPEIIWLHAHSYMLTKELPPRQVIWS